MALVVACQALPPTQTATGVVLAVDGPTVAQVDRFTLRTGDGQVLVMEVEALSLIGGGKPAPHLREHMISGEPIVVEYRVEDGRTLAIRYSDAE